MSRSYRKVPMGSSSSEKGFRTETSRKLRHRTKKIVKDIVKDAELPSLPVQRVLREMGYDLGTHLIEVPLAEEVVFPVKDEVVNQYDSPKDDSWCWPVKDASWLAKILRK